MTTAHIIGATPPLFCDSVPPVGTRATPADQQEAARHLERHGTYTHTGYPFMQLAKATGADYGDVLVVADWVNGPHGPIYNATPKTIKHARRISADVFSRICALVALPVDQRGGNHFP